MSPELTDIAPRRNLGALGSEPELARLAWRLEQGEDGETIDFLTCEGARDMPVWPYLDPIADPV